MQCSVPVIGKLTGQIRKMTEEFSTLELLSFNFRFRRILLIHARRASIWDCCEFSTELRRIFECMEASVLNVWRPVIYKVHSSFGMMMGATTGADDRVAGADDRVTQRRLLYRTWGWL